MSIWEFLKKENYPRDTCLCGMFPSLSKIVESIKEDLEGLPCCSYARLHNRSFRGYGSKAV